MSALLPGPAGKVPQLAPFPSFQSYAALPAQGREMSMAMLLAATWRHRVFAGAWTLMTLGLAALVILNLSPRYRADAVVALDTRQIQFSDVSAVVSGAGNMLDSNFVRSEVAIVSSRDFARKVVTELGLSTLPEFAPPLPRLARLVAGITDALDRCCEVLKPATGRLKAFAAGLRPQPLAPADQFAATIDAYQRNLQVANDGRSYIITISFTSPDPELAQRIADRHAEVYIESQRLAKDRALSTATMWLDREVSQLASRLAAAETALQDYREQHNLFSSNIQPAIQQQNTSMATQLALAETELIQRSARLQAATSQDGASSMTEITGSEILSRLREREITYRDKLGQAITSFGEAHPTVAPLRMQLMQIQRTIADEQRKIMRGIATEVDIARQHRNDLKQNMAELQSRLAAVQRDQLGAQQLEREASALRSLYESLLSRQKQVATQVGIQRADAYIVSSSQRPSRPYYPNTSLFFAVAAMLSAGSATGLSLLLDRRQKGFVDLEQVQMAIGLRKLAVIPQVDQGARSQGLVLADLVADRPRSAAAEAIRTLRNAIAFEGADTKGVVAVTSSLPGDGKTSVALALARSLAGPKRRVLLIEADLHRRTLAKLISLDADQPGIVRVLTGACRLDQAVVADRVPGVDLLLAETSVAIAQDLLVPASFHPLIASARQAYDYVVVDTPPLGIVSDALLIGRTVETTLLVIGAGRTPREYVEHAMQKLHAAGIPLMGAVLNWADPDLPIIPGTLARRFRSAATVYLEG